MVRLANHFYVGVIRRRSGSIAATILIIAGLLQLLLVSNNNNTAVQQVGVGVDAAAGIRWADGFKKGCPPWAQVILCDVIDEDRDQSIPYRYRTLAPGCPLACQVCHSHRRWRHRTAAEDEQYLIEEEFRHCNRPALTPSASGTNGGRQHLRRPHDDDTAHDTARLSPFDAIWAPGDSDRMYRRILTQFPQYSPKVLSRPGAAESAGDHETETASDGDKATTSINGDDVPRTGPWIIVLENFTTEEEGAAMIGEMEYALRAEYGTDYALEDDPEVAGSACSSTQAWCSAECLANPRLVSLIAKVSHLVDMPWRYMEDLHFIKYVPGQKYGTHHDWEGVESETLAGPRLFTLLMYLNDVPVGGETCFPHLHSNSSNTGNNDTAQPLPPICVQPKRGRALIFPNVLNEAPDVQDNRTWHQAYTIEPPSQVKYASTVWAHLRDFQHADEMDCLTNLVDIYDPY